VVTIPPALLRGDEAPAPRTLVDIFRATVAAHPDSPALDNGREKLTYAALADAADELADALVAAGVTRGDRVGVRIPSGTTDLYVAILGILAAGASYVPVDHDDPDERARIVFGEAGVAAVVTTDLVIRADDRTQPTGESREDPDLTDDAWIIFTSGSTGTPKGVAVTHRNAAAFVDAESQMFLQGAPIGPGDRVMAGLSVAFDASCEEMWLAWRYGACLVPAPRSLVKSGVELGPWLTANDITVVSTVPTLVQLWPPDALAQVRLLILGGEACPPEIGARFATDTREVWNTYGPTEATVVACGAQLTGEPPVRIGLPLAGWDLAIVDEAGEPVPEGEEGELIIGGVGLARYLDPAKDAVAYAAMPTLGWERAYRSGDRVKYDGVGILFAGRKDDQVKVGGRRIELGEIDSALLQLPGVTGAGAAVRKSAAGNTLLVGYVTVEEGFSTKAATEQLRQDLPAALVPRLAVVDTIPTRTSGKIDRDALPWPLPSSSADGAPAVGEGPGGGDADGTAAFVAQHWAHVLGGAPSAPDEDFFDVGGGSLAAAQLVSRLRERFPEVTVGDIYEAPTVAVWSRPWTP
jgi:amino acid adenylation domain-containing protein